VAEIPHEEHNREDLESMFAQLEQIIATLTKMVTWLLVKKDREEKLVDIEHEETR
jgi:hypothetical protein